MSTIIDIVLPVFCLIGLGYLVARTGFLDETAGDGLAAFVLKVAVPILLMRSVAMAEFSDVNPWAFIGVYFTGVIVAWFVASALCAWVLRRDYRASVIAGVSAAFSNLVLLGIPLVERAYGPQGLQILFFLISLHLPVMMTISSFLMEVAVRADGVENSPLHMVGIGKAIAKNLAKNPIIIGICIGLLWRFSGYGVGGLVGDVMELLARTTGPLALFSLGMGLIKYGIKGNLLPAAVFASSGLIAMPLVVYVMGTMVLLLPPLWLKVAVLLAACPTGINAFLFATYFKTAQGLASNTIVLTLLGSMVTIPFWLSLTG